MRAHNEVRNSPNRKEIQTVERNAEIKGIDLRGNDSTLVGGLFVGEISEEHERKHEQNENIKTKKDDEADRAKNAKLRGRLRLGSQIQNLKKEHFEEVNAQSKPNCENVNSQLRLDLEVLE